MKKVFFLLMALVILIGCTSGMEIKENGEDILVDVIDYGNGVYYIVGNNPFAEEKMKKQEENSRPFGVELSKLIERNNATEIEVIAPFEEMGYTKGYYVVFTEK